MQPPAANMENPARRALRSCKAAADAAAQTVSLRSLFAVLQGWLYATLPAFVGDVTDDVMWRGDHFLIKRVLIKTTDSVSTS